MDRQDRWSVIPKVAYIWTDRTDGVWFLRLLTIGQTGQMECDS